MNRRPWYEKARRLYKSKGLTHLDFSRALGVSEPAISHYFSGRRRPDLDHLRRIAAVLEISLVELLEEEVLLAKDEEERRVLELLRALPDPQKALAIRLIEQLQPTAPTTE